MLGPLSLVAVGEQHHKPAHPLPLGVGRSDELIDDHLGTVHEISKLSLPDRERRGIGEAVAVLEAQHTRFGEDAVVGLEARLLG